MRYLKGFILLFFVSCGTPTQKQHTVVIGPKDTITVKEEPPPKDVVIEPRLPDGAISANFISRSTDFYGYVKKINTVKGTTIIAFEDNAAPEIILSETFGAQLSYLRFQEFDCDLLLVNAAILDPNFNKYYLYILKDGHWKLVVNGWAIHKDNKPDTLRPIMVNPENPDKMTRFYSVFDLDKNSELGYTWRLLEEHIDRLE